MFCQLYVQSFHPIENDVSTFGDGDEIEELGALSVDLMHAFLCVSDDCMQGMPRRDSLMLFHPLHCEGEYVHSGKVHLSNLQDTNSIHKNP